MTSGFDTEQQLASVLNKAAEQLTLKSYSLKFDTGAPAGSGYIGQSFKATIVNEQKNTEIQLFLKKAPSNHKQREELNIETLFKNEIYFYSEIYPSLKKYEEEHNVSQCFNNIPECIASENEVGKEVLVLRDITVEGFQLREKDLLLDEEHAAFIFKTYGHFHALSFCMKDQKPEVYQGLAKKLFNIMKMQSRLEAFTVFLINSVRECFDCLDADEDVDVRNKFQKYVNDTMKIFEESTSYKGKYSGIIHGDCWSNNMMFRYQDSKLVDIKLLDFQFVTISTPIQDLSYFFYVGGCKKLFDNLEHYLNIYHNSFSEVSRKLGCNPEKLLPRKSLSEEWKVYSKYGMLLATMVTRIKLTNQEDAVRVIENMTNSSGKDIGQGMMNVSYDKNLFRRRIRDILVHMNEINAL